MWPGFAGAQQTLRILSPSQNHVAGQPLRFSIQAIGFHAPKAMTLYYRPIGIAAYKKIPLMQRSPLDFTVTVPGQKAIPPGIEFYLVVQDAKGQVFTFPENEPKKAPYAIPIDLDRNPPYVLEVYPGDGSTVEETRPTLRVVFEDAESEIANDGVRLLLDGEDVTGVCEITDREILYRPETDLANGEHRATIDLMDVFGNRMGPAYWIFTIKSDKKIKVSGNAQLDVEVREKFADREGNACEKWNAQSSLTVSSLAEKGQLATAFDGNAWYVEQEGPEPVDTPWNLNHFLWQLRYGNQYLALGDVQVEGTQLISPQLSRRGGVAALHFLDTDAEVFAIRSNTITGFEQGVGFGKSSQRITGGSIKKEILNQGRLTAKLTYMRGKNQIPCDYNASSLEGGSQGRIYSLLMTSRLLGDKLAFEGEYSGSNFDVDISDDQGRDEDKAYRAVFSGFGADYDWKAGYSYLGPYFQSIANPASSRDQEEVFGDGGIRFNEFDLRMSLYHTRDNVEDKEIIPVMLNTNGTLCLTMARLDWPVVTLTQIINAQNSTNEPTDFEDIENRTYSNSLGLSWNREKWNFSPTYTFTKFKDKAMAGNDTRSHVAVFNGGLKPADWFSITHSLAYERLYTELNGVIQETYQGAIGGIITFLDDLLDLNISGSFTKQQADDNSIKTTLYSAIGQLNCNLERHLLDKGYQTFSIRAQYDRTRDHLTDEAADDYTIFAILSIGIPIRFPFDSDL
jgi:hypothetical protein